MKDQMSNSSVQALAERKNRQVRISSRLSAKGFFKIPVMVVVGFINYRHY